MLWRGSAVVVGWYAIVAGAVALWVSSLDDREPVDCAGWPCWSDQTWGLVLTRAAAFYLLPLCVLASVVVLVATANRMRTGWSAGWLAVAGGMVGGPVLFAVALAAGILG